MKKSFTGVVFALFISMAWAPGASATDGHFLHGVGAINSAMGGVGVAGAKDDVLGALYHNPAGLMGLDGHHAAFSMELFKPDRTLTATAPTQQGLFTGIPAEQERVRSDSCLRVELRGRSKTSSSSASADWASADSAWTTARTTCIPSWPPRPRVVSGTCSVTSRS